MANSVSRRKSVTASLLGQLGVFAIKCPKVSATAVLWALILLIMLWIVALSVLCGMRYCPVCVWSDQSGLLCWDINFLIFCNISTFFFFEMHTFVLNI
jgi:hypothetical protein